MSIRSSKATYEYVVSVGEDKVKKTVDQSMVNAVLAGMFIALGGFAAAVSSHAIENFSLAKLVSGFVFPVGLILVVICGAELFTGNILLVVAWLEKKISFKEMAKNWTLVYLGNLIGIAIIALMIFYSSLLDSNSGMLGAYAIKAASKKVSLSFSEALIRGILCNILVCMAVWGSYTSKSTTGKVLLLHLPVMAFIISGFEHSIANMYYFIIGFLAKGNEVFREASHIGLDKINQIDLLHIINNLIPVTIGNIIGGTVFVGGLYWLVNKKAIKKEDYVKPITTTNILK